MSRITMRFAQFTVAMLFILLSGGMAHGQLQALIDATPAGGGVTLPAGETYTGSITISQPITIDGNGCTLDASGESFGISIASDVDDVTIEGFTIIGDASTTSGITVNPGASNVTIRNNDISGMALPNSNDSPLSYGILCWGNSDPVNPPMNILIEGNDIHGVSGTAISLGDNTNGVTIHNNQLRDITPVIVSGTPWASGVQASTANGLVISGNAMSNLITASSLLICTNVSLDSNQYVGTTACMLLATVPNDIDVDAEDWWSVENGAVLALELPALIQYFNSAEAQALTATAFDAFMIPTTLSSSHPGCMDSEACNYDADAISDDGSCGIDVDGDLICDDVDPCIGVEDGCGVCNGPGAIYDCGCADIPEGDCDCDGNVDDVLGECGGSCSADADNDGICDDEDACIGEYDALGICNGECLADEDGDGICDDVDDCIGQLDALGDCNGTCEFDTDGDGVCDTDEISGCQDDFACNYEPLATDSAGCVYYSVTGTTFNLSQPYWLGPATGAPNVVPLCDGPIQPVYSFPFTFVPTEGGWLEFSVDSLTQLAVIAAGYEAAYDDTQLWEAALCISSSDTAITVRHWESDDHYHFHEFPWHADSNAFHIPDGGYGDGFIAPTSTLGVGCNDPAACNFSPCTAPNPATCTYAPSEYQNCDGECFTDSNENDVCDQLEVTGCMDPLAMNFEETATLSAECEYFPATCVPVFDPEIADTVFVSCVGELPLEAPEQFAYDPCTEDNPVDVLSTMMDIDTMTPCAQFVAYRYVALNIDYGLIGIQYQTYVVNDTTGPVISSVPENLVIACSDDSTAYGEVEAIDSCHDLLDLTYAVDTTYVDSSIVVCPGNKVLERTVTARDVCENVSMARYTITVRDTIAPVLSNIPVHDSLSCEAPIPPHQVAHVDDCGVSTLHVHSATVEGSCPENYTLIRTFTAEDECENESSAIQEIVFIDTVAPVISTMPADLILSCEEAVVDSAITASDNCSSILIIALDSVTPGACPQERVILRTHTATDACGNSSAHVQTIEIVDDVAPEFTSLEAFVSTSCGDAYTVYAAAEDTCSEVTLTFASFSAYGAPTPGQQIRLYTAMDECGNSTEGIQMVSFTDAGACSGCTNETAQNYDATALLDDGSCDFGGVYTQGGNCNIDTDQDGICDQLEIPGCLDTLACNYTAYATDSVPELCAYPTDPARDCNGDCLEDADEDGICDADEVAGCRDILACNFNFFASDSDPSMCNYGCKGCTYAQATNFDDDADQDDGSCEFDLNEVVVETCDGDADGDGQVGIHDLLSVLEEYGSYCD